MAQRTTTATSAGLLKGRFLGGEHREEMDARRLAALPRCAGARDALAKFRPSWLQGRRRNGAAISALPGMLALAVVHAAGRLRRKCSSSWPRRPAGAGEEAKRELQKLKQRGVSQSSPRRRAGAKPCQRGERRLLREQHRRLRRARVWWTRPARQGWRWCRSALGPEGSGRDALTCRALLRVRQAPPARRDHHAEIPKDHARQLMPTGSTGARTAVAAARLRGGLDPGAAPAARPSPGSPRSARRAGAPNRRRGLSRPAVHGLDSERRSARFACAWTR